ncbi:MAG TPA: DUF4229 domain-containing protein [Nocardioidaceae bacterium]|nr:DUF4229 domain-containing protein [Nocardioidaceae bacterium]
MKQFIVYTFARLGLFVASYAVIIAIFLLVSDEGPLPTLWPLLAAVVVSSIASVYLLRRQREQLAAVVERRAAAATRRYDAARSKEDETEG